jgi:hypothetical protein
LPEHSTLPSAIEAHIWLAIPEIDVAIGRACAPAASSSASAQTAGAIAGSRRAALAQSAAAESRPGEVFERTLAIVRV